MASACSTYGARPANEIILKIHESSGWFDRQLIILVRLLTAALFAIGSAATITQLVFNFPYQPVMTRLFGSYDVFWRGLLAALAIIWGIFAAVVHQRQIEPGFSGWQLIGRLPAIILGGVIGGRLAVLLLPPPSLAAVGAAGFSEAAENLTVALNLRQGGVAPAGVLVGGLAALAIFRLLKPGIVIGWTAGQLILVWANLFESAYFGPPLSWGMPIAELNRLPQWGQFERFHPLFFYEAVGLMVIFVVLTRFFTSNRSFWWFLAVYLALYGALRGVLGVFNPNTFLLDWGGFSMAAWSVIWFAVSAAAGAFLLARRNTPENNSPVPG